VNSINVAGDVLGVADAEPDAVAEPVTLAGVVVAGSGDPPRPQPAVARTAAVTARAMPMCLMISVEPMPEKLASQVADRTRPHRSREGV
jgi:hypothetical protein